MSNNELAYLLMVAMWHLAMVVIHSLRGKVDLVKEEHDEFLKLLEAVKEEMES